MIFGKTGQVAKELFRVGWSRGATVARAGREDCDLANTDSIRQIISASSPDLVINAAAYTSVDRAESEPEMARAVNRDAPRAMAEACAKAGAALIHLSTDYVFDGDKTDPYIEQDATGPLSIYGQTKADGEEAIRNTLDRHLIIRTSWIFSAHGTNFVKTMLKLARCQPTLRVVADQKGAPTSARDIAGVLSFAADRIELGIAAWGTFHFTSAEPTAWFEFARSIFEMAGGLAHPAVLPIATADYPTAARRPANSVLDCARIGELYGIAQPSWRTALKDVLSELSVDTGKKNREYTECRNASD